MALPRARTRGMERSGASVAVALSIIVCAIITTALAYAATYVPPGVISPSHPPNSSYLSPYNRPGNYTLNITHVPGVIRGVTPALKPPVDLKYDVVRNPGTVQMDPRTCYNDLAYCYQTIDHSPENRTTFGKNYTGVSGYMLPETRVRTFACIGDDRACVKSATFCFCPTEIIPPFSFANGRGQCSDTTHLCTKSYSSLTLCKGNLSYCQQKYLDCGCGTNDCIANKNTCFNTRGQFTECSGPIQACLEKYGACYCGPDMMSMQTGCRTEEHECSLRGVRSKCYGSLSACAPKYDWCDC